MFIGHIPAGYLVTRTILQALDKRPWPVSRNKLLALGMLAGVLPDIDLLYFHFMDNRQHLHHSYWTHTPFFWMLIIGTLSAIAYFTKKSAIVIGTCIVGANIFFHLLLDTLVGSIRWLYPVSDAQLVVFHVPAKYGWWVLNFIFHWTFVFELILIVLAAGVAWRGKPSPGY